MVENKTPEPKKASSGPSKYDLPSVMPVLLAAQGNPVINFKNMAALDPQGRTNYAWETQFRKWRAAAQALIEANPGIVNTSGMKVKKTPVKKAASMAAKESSEPVSESADDGDNDGGEDSSPAKSPKKRTANDLPEIGSPTKKTKAAETKKGTAKPKKAGSAKAVKSEDDVAGEQVEMQFEEAV